MDVSRRQLAGAVTFLLATQGGLARAEEAAKTTVPQTIGRAVSPAGDWREAVVRELGRRKRYPETLRRAARKAKQEPPSGMTLIGFAVDANGRIVEASVKTSSGNAEFDKAALAMVPVGLQLPKPPFTLPTDPLPLSVQVRFVGNEEEPRTSD